MLLQTTLQIWQGLWIPKILLSCTAGRYKSDEREEGVIEVYEQWKTKYRLRLGSSAVLALKFLQSNMELNAQERLYTSLVQVDSIYQCLT